MAKKIQLNKERVKKFWPKMVFGISCVQPSLIHSSTLFFIKATAMQISYIGFESNLIWHPPPIKNF